MSMELREPNFATSAPDEPAHRWVGTGRENAEGEEYLSCLDCPAWSLG